MVRKGRELEKTIERLEKIVNDSGFEITSPDWIEDKITRQKREVDISLKGQFGPISRLVILECRDRGAKEDVTWIEQLATKRNDVGADMAIAISSTGFTKGAKIKAKHYKIELRTLGEIDRQLILDWFKPDSFPIIHNHYKFRKVVVSIIGLNEMVISLRQRMNALLNEFPLDAPILLQKGLLEPISLNDLFKRMQGFDELYVGLTPSAGAQTYAFTLIPEEPRSVYQLILDEKISISIDKIDIEVEVWKECKKLPIESIKEYKEDNRVLGHILRSKPGTIFGKNQSFELVFMIKDGGRQVSIRIVDLSQEM